MLLRCKLTVNVWRVLHGNFEPRPLTSYSKFVTTPITIVSLATYSDIKYTREIKDVFKSASGECY